MVCFVAFGVFSDPWVTGEVTGPGATTGAATRRRGTAADPALGSGPGLGSVGPKAGQRADFEGIPARIRPKSGPEDQFPARKRYCVTYGGLCKDRAKTF